MWSMVEICADEPTLFLNGRIVFSIASLRPLLIMVVVAPLREMVCEFQARGVGGCIFEIDNYELFVGVCW